MGDPISIALLVASTGATFGAGVAKAAGEARATDFKAGEAATQARFGRIAADETVTALTDELRGVTANIRAIRASSGISPDSPTTNALIERETGVSRRERRIRTANIMGQVESDERSSRFLRRSARSQFLYGTAAAAGNAFSSLAGA